MGKLLWTLSRLLAMSPAEVFHRFRTLAVVQCMKRGLFTAESPPSAVIPHGFDRDSAKVEGVSDKSAYLKAADEILTGRFPVFAVVPDYDIRTAWNRDPLTGKDAPLDFGMTLNYRDPKLVGNIKYLWEPNRCLEVATVAQAFHFSGDAKYLEGLRGLLDSWIDRCPYPLGPNWTSSLELAIRLINWGLAWRLSGGAGSPLFASADGFQRRFLDAVYRHCHFINGHFSLHSSANNHLIGEAAGLFIASVTWPFWSESAKWRDAAFEILVREIDLQNAPDGVNREQAISYQQFVLDFMLLALLAGKRAGIGFPASFTSRKEAMMEYVASLMDVSGNVPMIGDADDGYVVRLSREEDFCPFRSLLATGAVLFRRGDFKRKAGRFDDKSRWLLGDGAEEQFNAIPCAVEGPAPKRAFPEGGYYVLGDRFETLEEVRMVADAGPLGYLSIAAHGHADALSFTLSVGGLEFLIDPGTYAYHTQKKWRDYFRGTSAHNTVRIDGQDQSVIGGNFMWLKKANAQCERWEAGDQEDLFIGNHDGYRRLKDPVVIRRAIRFNKAERRILIEDTIQCKKMHKVERCWHFSEKCRVAQQGAQIVATQKHVSVLIEAGPQDTGKVQLYNGSEDPPFGWVSRRFGVKEPTATAVWTNEIEGETVLTTEIKIIFDQENQ